MTGLATRIGYLLGYGWAQPVVRRRSAIWCSLLQGVMRLSRYRVLGHRTHMAWQRACGIT